MAYIVGDDAGDVRALPNEQTKYADRVVSISTTMTNILLSFATVTLDGTPSPKIHPGLNGGLNG